MLGTEIGHAASRCDAAFPADCRVLARSFAGEVWHRRKLCRGLRCGLLLSLVTFPPGVLDCDVKDKLRLCARNVLPSL
eukprot:3537957-Rhodomonas_salina.1